jgi:hypothetical protein
MRGWELKGDGYAGSLSCSREVSAVSGTSFMISLSTLESIGGGRTAFKTDRFRFADLSLRARTKGKRNVCVARAILREYAETVNSPPVPFDGILFADSWSEAICAGDPFYNPGFDQRLPGYQTGAQQG